MSNKRYTIREIARLAGVSTGTVDRVIHNRGEVSENSRIRVEQTLKRFEYKPSLTVSSLSTRKNLTITAVLPMAQNGYWASMKQGIKHALYEFSHVKMKIKFLHYDQFDLYSFRDICKKALGTPCDAMLIGPTFIDETLLFTDELDTRGVPYVYVDEYIHHSNPLAFFGSNSEKMGYIQAKLLLTGIPAGSEVMMLRARRIGDNVSTNGGIRRKSFQKYIQEKAIDVSTFDAVYDVFSPDANHDAFDRIFREHPDIRGIAAFNSRAYIMANYLKANKIRDIRMVGYGLIEPNIKALREDYLTYLLSERPDRQGYLGIKCILEFLLFGKRGTVVNNTPVDILIDGNVDEYLNNIG